MMCNQNENSTGLIGGFKGFAISAQFLLATKIGEATAIKNIGSNEPWDIGHLWKPVSDQYPFCGNMQYNTRKVYPKQNPPPLGLRTKTIKPQPKLKL